MAVVELVGMAGIRSIAGAPWPRQRSHVAVSFCMPLIACFQRYRTLGEAAQSQKMMVKPFRARLAGAWRGILWAQMVRALLIHVGVSQTVRGQALQ